jgi:serine/threonine protein kinase
LSTPRIELGRFRIDGTLGRGGMAVVYLGYDAELQRPVAVKLIADHLAQDDEFRARFLREARIAARLSHANIVQVFDIGQDHRQRPFIVMEYVEGETLADKLAREGHLAAPQVVEIGLECCAGLAYAHAAGLIHRDIKPQNLLVAIDGTIKLADFGVARALDQTQITQTGSILGTARYLAPEQAAGKRVTAAADIYSLGVVLYELLTGRTPYHGLSLTELVLAQRQRPVVPIGTLRSDVPAWLDTAVRSCLAPAPRDRPAAETLARHLTATDTRPQPATEQLGQPHSADKTLVLIDAPTGVDRATPPRIPTRRSLVAPRWRWGAAALAAIVAIAVGIIFTLTAGGGQSTPPSPPATPTGSTPAQHAQNLARWIHDHTS